MPSPFPGMDPYLENPALWPDVHHRLISTAARALAPQLRPKYLVRVEVRVYVTDESDPSRPAVIPDLRVVVAPRPRRRPALGRTARTAGALVAVPDEVEPVEGTMVMEEEVREASLKIIDATSHSVVTVLEFLSPSNKVTGGRGRESYAGKRAMVMASESNLVEIDLLREGRRFGPQEALPPHDYLAHVSRADRRPKATLWPIRLDQRLPSIPIPTRTDGPTGSLDLQAVLDAVYEEATYDAELDYAVDPVPPLPPKWRGWAKKLLAGKRRR